MIPAAYYLDAMRARIDHAAACAGGCVNFQIQTRHAQQHVVLTLGELRLRQPRLVGTDLRHRARRGEVGQDAPGDARRQRRFALGHALQLFNQLRTGLLFQQVTESAGLEGGEEVLVVIVDGDHHAERFRLQLPETGHDFHA